jgi:hypothetical protein
MATPKKTTTTRKTTTATTATTRARTTTTRAKAAAAAAPLPSGLVEVTHDAIARRAYEIAESAGFPSGRETEFWLEAERQLREGALVG